MNKKAISPLIASVLLIGFTVALAVVVMTWGGGFIKKTTEKTSSEADVALACANLNLQITGANCESGTVTVSNTKNYKIIKLVFRNLDATGNILGNSAEEIGTSNAPVLDAYGSKPFDKLADGAYKIQVIPTLEGGIVCADAPAEKVLNCPAATA